MHRRRVLQMGAVLAALPIAGCGPTTPQPRPAPPGTDGVSATGGASGATTTGATTTDATTTDATAAAAPTPSATPGSDAGTAQTDRGAGGASGTPDDPPKQEPASLFSRVIGKVGKNHGHVLTVSFADVKAAAAKTYDLTGTSTHPHSVTLSADDMKSLLAGQIVRMKSSRDKQHAHRVLVRCAPAADPPEWVTACEATFSGQDEHELVVPAADLAAKVAKTYDVQGIAGHAHQITVTPDDFRKLAKGEGVSLKTTRDPDDAHLHVVFIQYRPPKT